MSKFKVLLFLLVPRGLESGLLLLFLRSPMLPSHWLFRLFPHQSGEFNKLSEWEGVVSGGTQKETSKQLRTLHYHWLSSYLLLPPSLSHLLLATV